MVKRISAVAGGTPPNPDASGLDRSALFNLFFAFHVVANRRARSTAM